MNRLKNLFSKINIKNNIFSNRSSEKKTFKIQSDTGLFEVARTTSLVIPYLSNPKKAKKLASKIKANKKRIKSISSFDQLLANDNKDLLLDIEELDYAILASEERFPREVLCSDLILSDVFIDRDYESFYSLLINSFTLILFFIKEFLHSIKALFFRNIQFFFRKVIRFIFKNMDDYHEFILVKLRNITCVIINLQLFNQNKYYERKINRSISV
ncbi:MAG TPA: hypothetical protein PK904_14480 [Bacteroidales bacterium]|nr:hypothetical protein [Bacteroidales bacterium]